MSEQLKQACVKETASNFLNKIQIERYYRLKFYEDEFEKIFGKPLHLYCDYLAGFDPIPFWNEVLPHCPNGVSYRSWTRQHFGDRAPFLVHELINCL